MLAPNRSLWLPMLLVCASPFLIPWASVGLADEQVQATEGEGEKGLQREVDRLLSEFDRDRDGRLNRDELAAALRSLLPPKPLTLRNNALETAENQLEFLRVVRNDEGEAESLETSIISFTDKRGHVVDLIGAVHVGDRAYYRELNTIFRNYDAVLYELVAPEGTRIPRGGAKSTHPIGRLQSAIKTMLNLSLQLEEIDYTAEYLVHADMSPTEFAETMKARGESFWQMLFRMMGQAAKQSENKHTPTDRDLLYALFAPDRDLRLKRIMATQFEDLETQMALFAGPNGSTIITERNKKALQVLKQELDRDERDRLAIFYGAGHMPDMAARLQDDFGLKPTETRWLKAWDMADKGKRR